MNSVKVGAVALSLSLGFTFLSAYKMDHSPSNIDSYSLNDSSSNNSNVNHDITEVNPDYKDTSEQATPVQQSDTPQIGMTGDQVKATTWGEPAEDNKTTIAGDVSEQWVYYDDGTPDRYVYLDNGVVTAIQDQE